MPRQARLDAPGTVHQVTLRGHNGVAALLTLSRRPVAYSTIPSNPFASRIRGWCRSCRTSSSPLHVATHVGKGPLLELFEFSAAPRFDLVAPCLA